MLTPKVINESLQPYLPYLNEVYKLERFTSKEKTFKCKGKHRYELIANSNWVCTCGKELNL